MTDSAETYGDAAIDDRTRALACIAAAIAIGATSTTMESLTDRGLSAGATDEQILATLIAVAPIVGSARVVGAAGMLARAVGYDIDRALESHDEDLPSYEVTRSRTTSAAEHRNREGGHG